MELSLKNKTLNAIVENVFNTFQDLTNIEENYNYNNGKNHVKFKTDLTREQGYQDYIDLRKAFLSKMELLIPLFELERYSEAVSSNWNSEKQGRKSTYNVNKIVFQKILQGFEF